MCGILRFLHTQSDEEVLGYFHHVYQESGQGESLGLTTWLMIEWNYTGPNNTRVPA